MRLMSVFLFSIKGRSCPNAREHERPDYTSRAAQSHVSEQSEHFSGVVGLIVVKLHPPFSVFPTFSNSLAMISHMIIIRTDKVVRRGSNLYIFHLHLLSLESQARGVIAMCGRVHSPTNDSVNHSWANTGECIRRCAEVALQICNSLLKLTSASNLFFFKTNRSRNKECDVMSEPDPVCHFSRLV
jgi:hypothetical protein